ncbi:MAG: ATP-dependent helicase C-terminal domain-containing protein [Pseudomonadota bacterium]
MALAAGLEAWLAPFLDRMSRLSHLKGLDLGVALRAALDWAQQRALDEAAPTHIVVPSGSRLPIDYQQGDVPVARGAAAGDVRPGGDPGDRRAAPCRCCSICCRRRRVRSR